MSRMSGRRDPLLRHALSAHIPEAALPRKASMRSNVGAAMSFRKEWVERKRKVVLEKNMQARADCAPQSRQFNSEGGSAIAEQPWPSGAIDLSVALSMCPAPVRICEDHVNGRWQVFYPGIGSCSRAWAAHGHNEACRQLLEWAWSEVLDLQGMSKSGCPILGLLRASEAGAPATTSQAPKPDAASRSAVRPVGHEASSSSAAPPPAKRTKR